MWPIRNTAYCYSHTDTFCKREDISIAFPSLWRTIMHFCGSVHDWDQMRLTCTLVFLYFYAMVNWNLHYSYRVQSPKYHLCKLTTVEKWSSRVPIDWTSMLAIFCMLVSFSRFSVDLVGAIDHWKERSYHPWNYQTHLKPRRTRFCICTHTYITFQMAHEFCNYIVSLRMHICMHPYATFS